MIDTIIAFVWGAWIGATTSAHLTRITIALVLANWTDTASVMWQILALFVRNGKETKHD